MTATQIGGSVVTVVGVRHHSPACARLVEATIRAVRPAYVLVEGPADMNDRLDELRLPHQLPIAVFTSYHDEDETGGSWSPFCDYSPEWVALRTADEVDAEFRFIDLPAWHPAFHDRTNRYSDADRRYADTVEHLCHEFGVDNIDALWDHLAETASEPHPGSDLADRLDVYFAAVRGDADASPSDVERETYMSQWVRAAAAQAGDRPVVVVCGGFHRPALVAAAASSVATDAWPALPERPGRHDSFLVPFSFKRLDAFDGYQSGMPSPAYYQQLWTSGAAAASRHLIESVTTRLRERRHPVSTADLIAANTTALGLARVRGHAQPTRTDVLDGLVSALVSEALERPAPWTGRGRLVAGTHPVIVEMIAALSGARVGTLDPRTPLPPLVHDVTATLERLGLDGDATVNLDLTKPDQRSRSTFLHRLRILAIPGIECVHSATPGVGVEERWRITRVDRMVALIEAGAYGPTLDTAAAARLDEQVRVAGQDIEQLAAALLEAVRCGIDATPERILAAIRPTIAGTGTLAPLGRVLSVVLALWRHDRLYGLARSGTLAIVLAACVQRVLWLAEGIHGGPAPADNTRLRALVATRDTIRYAAPATVETVDADAAVAVMTRIAADQTAPPDLRGAAVGFTRSLAAGPVTTDGSRDDLVRATRGASTAATLGDWLAGLFALAREEILDQDTDLLGLLDTLVARMSDHEFLVALPSLRQAFAWFPPRERETIAQRLLARHGVTASGPPLIRLGEDPLAIARARELDAYVDTLLTREGLIPGRDAT